MTRAASTRSTAAAFLVIPALALLLAGARAESAGSPGERTIAVTFDDVPGVATVAGTCDAAATRWATTRSAIAT